MRSLIQKICPYLFLLILLLSCNTDSGLDLDTELLQKKWICREVYNNDERQEIFSGAYALNIKDDKTYSYKAGMHEDIGTWSVIKEELLLESKDNETKKLSVLTLNDTSLVIEMEQFGEDLRMIFISEE